MTDEHLHTKIRNSGIGIHSDTITVEIDATARRKEDFEAVRDAVREVLGLDD